MNNKHILAEILREVKILKYFTYYICLIEKWNISDALQLSKQNCWDVFTKENKNLH